MAALQHLDNRQIDEVIQAACRHAAPAALTVQEDSAWLSFRSRFVAARGGHVWLGLPAEASEGGRHAERFAPASRIGVSFKLKHHKHVFTAIVAGSEQVARPDGEPVAAVKLCSPTSMHRMQRRAFIRADVPPNRVVRASFWMGGVAAEPAGPNPLRPVWTGRVINISAGGFQLITDDQAVCGLEVGETVGVRISFGSGEPTVYADAQFRHVQPMAAGLAVGFQFVGLAHSDQGRKTLQFLGTKTAQFQRETAARTAAR
ncbi:MAG: PilZ domain-containing protein [Planctomycetes bacterium]|nr:PilZ domain-containing protein [Planctomycetota bacterium]